MIRGAAVVAFVATVSPAIGADAPQRLPARGAAGVVAVEPFTISGHAAVLDGRTLLFAKTERRVRLARLDACALPQWSFEKTGYPYPCGAFAKAWLKRLVALNTVRCRVEATDADGTPLALCSIGGKDIGVNVLRVGAAKTVPGAPDCCYNAVEKKARDARYGMWATYVLNPPEWRRKAVGRTLKRQPRADITLLREREREISPPFHDPHPVGDR
jgi:endonuclease YncB( thermonuclease family)